MKKDAADIKFETELLIATETEQGFQAKTEKAPLNAIIQTREITEEPKIQSPAVVNKEENCAVPGDIQSDPPPLQPADKVDGADLLQTASKRWEFRLQEEKLHGKTVLWQGHFKKWFEGEYAEGKRVETWRYWTHEGQLCLEHTFKDDCLIHTKCFSPSLIVNWENESPLVAGDAKQRTMSIRYRHSRRNNMSSRVQYKSIQFTSWDNPRFELEPDVKYKDIENLSITMSKGLCDLTPGITLFPDLKSLTILILTGNFLAEFPESFGRIDKREKLSIANNRLEK